jgi:uncharacterized repeat protein (TIGR02543 family)
LGKPTRTGYTFTGWWTSYSGVSGSGTNYDSNADGTITQTDINTIVSGGTTALNLYAGWAANSYAVTYNMNGRGTAPTSPTSVSYGSTTSLGVPAAVTGYTFGGWYAQSACTNQLTTAAGAPTGTYSGRTSSGTWAATAGFTVYAKWTANSYAVTYNMNGRGTAPTSPTSVSYGSTTALGVPAAVTGYTFGGWYAQSACTNQLTTAAGAPTGTYSGRTSSGTWVPTAGFTVYAKWTANTYTVTFNGASPSAVTISPSTKSVTYNSTYGTLATATRSGYSFDGWFTKDGRATGDWGTEITSSAAVTITAAQTLYARWVCPYYLHFMDGVTVAGSTGWYYGSAVTLPTAAEAKVLAPAKASKTFGGWYDNPNFTGTAYTSIPLNYTGELNFFAKWV